MLTPSEVREVAYFALVGAVCLVPVIYAVVFYLASRPRKPGKFRWTHKKEL